MSSTRSRIQPPVMSVSTQYIDRGVFTTSQPRPAVDGLESRPAERGQTYSSTPLGKHHPPPFFDSAKRYSTDTAYKQRQSIRDVSHGEGLLFKGLDTSGSLHQPGSYFQDWDKLNREMEVLKKNLLEKETELQRLKKEGETQEGKTESLEMDLTRQSQVNKELKKMLVASMGADLQVQLETLIADKSQLAQDLENTVAVLTEERESLERVSIQCDVWRSKFLGSRVQVDEVVTLRSKLDILLQECTYAMQKLLEERGEMRRHMMKTNGTLTYLSNALQRSHSLRDENFKPPSNVMTLALLNEQLSSTISHHLLGDVAKNKAKKGPKKDTFEFVDWTTAEMLAKDIILNKQPLAKQDQLIQPTIPRTTSNSSIQMIHRYHPTTKYENITVNCCKYCKGDILVV